MVTRKLMAVTAITCLLSAIALTAFFWQPEESIQTDFYPEKLSVRYEFRKGENSREVEYWEDLETRKHAVASNKDGSESEFWYRRDGTLTKLERRGEEVDGLRPVLRLASVDTDGKTFLRDEEFYAGGKTKRLLVLVDQNTSEEQIFHPGVERRLKQASVFSREEGFWQLLSQEERRSDGTLVRTFLFENQVKTTRFFDENEVVYATHVHDLKADEYKEEEYKPGTETLVRSVHQDDDGTVINLYRPETGVLAEQLRWYGEPGKSDLHADRFDEQGRRYLNQWWIDPQNGVLNNAVVYYPAEQKMAYRIFLATQGKGKGNVTDEVIYHTPNEAEGRHTVRKYREDGTLESENVYSKGSELSSSRTFTSSDGVSFDGDSSWLSLPKVKLPPYLIDYVPDDT